MYFVRSEFVFSKYQVQSYGIEQYLLMCIKNPRDLRQISTLGAKMTPGKGKFIVGAFQRAKKNPWSYLFRLQSRLSRYCENEIQYFA